MQEKFEKDIKSKNIINLCPSIFYYDKPEGNKATEYIRWFILDEQGMAFAGGKPLYTEFDIQVDIYSSNKDLRELSKELIKTLESLKYTVIENENKVVKIDNISTFNKMLRFRFNYYNYK